MPSSHPKKFILKSQTPLRSSILKLKGGWQMSKEHEIPIWRKYALSVEEAAAYFRIGENKIRTLINQNRNAEYLLWSGSRALIKRVKFEHFLDKLDAV